jgi:hypothetical protein
MTNGMCGIRLPFQGLGLFRGILPRALPWAGVVRPAGAEEFCTLAEQTRIVAEVERRVERGGGLEAVVSAKLQCATCLHQSILHRAF